jgi:hypothetical protein
VAECVSSTLCGGTRVSLGTQGSQHYSATVCCCNYSVHCSGCKSEVGIAQMSRGMCMPAGCKRHLNPDTLTTQLQFARLLPARLSTVSFCIHLSYSYPVSEAAELARARLVRSGYGLASNGGLTLPRIEPALHGMHVPHMHVAASLPHQPVNNWTWHKRRGNCK